MRTKRWAALVCHRRAGKTVGTIADLIDNLLRCQLPNPRGAYVAPTFVQAKDVAWEYAKRFSADIPGVKFNESELRIDYPTGARLRIYGAENYDRMRGLYLDFLVLDEFADMNPAAWNEVLRPALADRKGAAVFIGTPKGRNAFYDICERAKDDPNWFFLRLRASETGIVDPEELADARASMTPEQYATEFECSFDSAVIGSYYGADLERAQEEKRIGNIPHDPALPVRTYWDLGLDDATAVWFTQEVGKEVRLIEYAEWTQQPLTAIAGEILRRPYTYADHIFPHDIRVREMTTGRSREEVIRNLLGRLSIAPNLTVDDGINAVRVLFPRFYIDEKNCAKGLEALRNYRKRWDEKRKTFEPRPHHDWSSHGADSLRYLGVTYRERLQSQTRRDSYASSGRRGSGWAA
jgi:phage terminase large subunit